MKFNFRSAEQPTACVTSCLEGSKTPWLPVSLRRFTASISAMKRLIAVAAVGFIFSSCRGPQSEVGIVGGGDADPQYINSAECASCHAEIAETYRQTGMGRSFSRVASQTVGEGFKTTNT